MHVTPDITISMSVDEARDLTKAFNEFKDSELLDTYWYGYSFTRDYRDGTEQYDVVYEPGDGNRIVIINPTTLIGELDKVVNP